VAFPTAVANNQRLFLGSSLWISSFQFCEFKTIPAQEINVMDVTWNEWQNSKTFLDNVGVGI
jgi:hypothetical protein